MKHSLAAALRHSRDQAQRTYDRRTANEKKNMAVGLARRCARGQLDSDSSDGQTEDEREEEEDQDTPSSNASIKPGQFVGLVDDNSTLSQPRVWIGQVQSIANREVQESGRQYLQAGTDRQGLAGIHRQPRAGGNAGQERRFGHLEAADLTSRHPQSCHGLTLVFSSGVENGFLSAF